MLSIVHSAAVLGIEAYLLTIEVDIKPGLPGFSMVGLPDSAVKEARERVFSALRNSGFEIPSRRMTINLAPADIKKEGTSLDLPLAVGILRASEQIPPFAVGRAMLVGELALDGSLRPVKGVLPVAMESASRGCPCLIVPAGNFHEANMVTGACVYAVGHLSQVLEILAGRGSSMVHPAPVSSESIHLADMPDFSEVKGQGQARRAFEVAAAGAHNLICMGSPGCGKSLMARRLPSILPALSDEEALETTKIYSVAGLLQVNAGLIRKRPFRSPHHSISPYALVGGGSPPRPGELSLAHNGVLFLDELPEFRKSTLEALRQPLEESQVTIARILQTITYPSRVMLVCAMNPCPCGYLMDPGKRCGCRAREIHQYMTRLSGPLLDRIDIQLEIPRISFDEMAGAAPGESSQVIRSRVEKAREIQAERYRGIKGVFYNAHITGKELQRHCRVEGPAKTMLRQAVDSVGLSARAYDRILKVSRTLADLSGAESIEEDHVSEAIQYRSLDRRPVAHARPVP